MKKGKTLASLICSVMLSLSLIVGATFALFTSESKVNIVVTSGKVAVSASIENMVAYSGIENEDLSVTYIKREDSSFVNGGTVDAQAGEITLNKIAPMDKVTFDVVVDNTSDIVTKYQTKITFDESFAQNDADLFQALSIKVGSGCVKTATDATTNWYALQPGVDVTIPVEIELPKEVGNELQNKTIKLVCTVSAVQSNAYTKDPVADGEATKEYIEINSVQDLKDFRDAVNSGAQFQGKAAKTANVRLGANIDLANEAWTPIDGFAGTFEGKGYKISNLYVEKSESAGLFGTVSGAKISDFAIENVKIVSNHWAGAVAGWMYGTIKNVSVSKVDITLTPNLVNGAYDNGDKAGAIVGYAYNGNDAYVNISNCAASDVKIKGYRDLGGIAGIADANDLVGNTVDGVTLIVDQETGFYAVKDANAAPIVGRIAAGTLDESNKYANVAYSSSSETFERLVESLAKQDGTAKIVLTEDVVYATGAGHDSNPFVGENDALDTLIIDGQGQFKLTTTGAGVGEIQSANGGKLVFQNMTIEDKSESYKESAWELTYLELAGNLEFTNVDFIGGISVNGNSASFVDCSFLTNEDSVYAVWVSNGTSYFENCTFTGTRGLKTHEAYGSEVAEITIDGCTFENISKKPGMALGTLNANTTLTVKNSIFKNVQPGEQNLYYYETDTNVSSFNFVFENNQLLYKQVVVSTAEELTDAIENATVGTHVVFANDIVGNSIALQKANVDIIIDGDKHNYSGSIEIYGQARATGAETLTIQNVNFVINSDVDFDFIHQNTTESVKRYAHNVTVKDCTFEATGTGDVVAIRWRQCYNLTVENCEANNLHSFLWTTSSPTITIDDLTLTNCKNGLSFSGASTQITIKNSTIKATDSFGYGIRVEANGAYKLSVENCDITASAPILMRKATGAYELTLSDDNVLTPANENENACQIIVTKDDYGYDKDGNLIALTKPTGKYVINGGYLYSISVAKDEVADNASLNSAISNGSSNIQLGKGDYNMPSLSSQNITIAGDGENTKINVGKPNLSGSSVVTFENVTLVSKNENYTGLQHCNEIVYKNCTITGQPFLYGEKAVFVNCTFKQTSADAYNVWTYGCKNVEFIGCTFESAGKSVLIYHEGGGSNVTFTGCEFTASAPVAGKAAIEIDSSLCKNGATFNVVINNCTATGFDAGSVSEETLWNVKKDTTSKNATVTVDGSVVYPQPNA